MENKINIAEILKDCPRGMELDCTMYDNVVFEKLDVSSSHHPIILRRRTDSIDKYSRTVHLTKYGQYSDDEDCKCLIYPKGKTTWEGFVPPCKFKEGDVIYVEGLREWVAIVNSCNDNAIYDHVALENKTILHFSDNLPLIRFSDKPVKIRLAIEEEKKKLFDSLKEQGYKWNANTNTLEKLPKFKVGDKIIKKNGLHVPFVITGVSNVYYWSNTGSSVEVLRVAEQDDWELELPPTKFDITTLVPFESRVLVRDNDLQKWSPAMWGYYDCDSQEYPYKLVGYVSCYRISYEGKDAARYCIPYEGNEHLLGTTNDCDNFFKTW